MKPCVWQQHPRPGGSNKTSPGWLNFPSNVAKLCSWLAGFPPARCLPARARLFVGPGTVMRRYGNAWVWVLGWLPPPWGSGGSFARPRLVCRFVASSSLSSSSSSLASLLSVWGRWVLTGEPASIPHTCQAIPWRKILSVRARV